MDKDKETVLMILRSIFVCSFALTLGFKYSIMFSTQEKWLFADCKLPVHII